MQEQPIQNSPGTWDIGQGIMTKAINQEQPALSNYFFR